MERDPGAEQDPAAVRIVATGRRPQPAPDVIDVLVSVAATAVALVVMAASREHGARGADLFGGALLVLSGVALTWRQRAPAAALLGATALSAIYLALGYPGGAELPILMAGLHGAMIAGRRWLAVTVLATVVGASLAYRVLVDREDPLLVVITTSLLVLVVALGEATFARRQLAHASRERLRALRQEKELEAESAVTEERLRIARELHDVLAHTITAITVQAGAAADGLADTDPARQALRSMRTSAREAMRQLQVTIDVLRSEHEGTGSLAAPGLSDVPELIRTAREAGLDAELELDASQVTLPTAVELTAYRIIQESLTNVVRHADASRVHVAVRQQRNTLTVTVVDDGRGVGDGAGAAGFGLGGMRERVQALGGRFSAGRAPEHGFRVRAELPIQEVVT